MNPIFAATIAAGFLIGGGLFAVVGGLRRDVPALGSALQQLDGYRPDTPPAMSSWIEKVGYLARRMRVDSSTIQLVQLHDRSMWHFYGMRVLFAAVGFMIPTVVTIAAIAAGHPVGPIPAVVSVAGLVMGWFLPRFRLRRAARVIRADLTETLLTYFDLVTLERLANASASQAMYSASTVSTVPLFRRIRAALDRARMEQQPPHLELQKVAAELELPALHDIADVLRLDEQGASLADVLRARVRELRDEHLTADKMRATETSERMTIWMTLPALLFGLTFLTPALLRLISSGS